MSYSSDDWQAVQACDEWMESGRAKVFNADLHGALADFHMAAAIFPYCAPALWCCAALNFMLDEKRAAKEYRLKANNNRERRHSDTSESVYEDIWDEFMNSIISTQPLQGSDIQVDYEEALPGLPLNFQSTCTSSQKYCVKALFTPEIKRAGNEVEVSLNLKKAEFGVSNFFRTAKFQGYFVYEFEIDASPSAAWKYCSCELITMGPGAGRNTQPVQQQSTSAYSAQFGTSGPTPGANLTYTYSDTISISSLQQQMIAYKAPGDEKVWRCTWKVNMYANGQSFQVLRSVREVFELPFDPRTHVCSDLGEFQGTWKVTSDEARNLHYHFDWDITLRAKLALVPRCRKRDLVMSLRMSGAIMPPREPLIHVARHCTVRMSDFSNTSKDRLLT